MGFFLCYRELQRLFDEDSHLLLDSLGIRIRANNADDKIIRISTEVEPLVLLVKWIYAWQAFSYGIDFAYFPLDISKYFCFILLSFESIPFLPEFCDLSSVSFVDWVYPPFSSFLILIFCCFHEEVKFMEKHICQDW